MKAVMAYAPYRFEPAELPDPVAGEGGRVLAVEAAGVCAADRMLWNGTGPWRVAWPFTPGHEILGRDTVTGERLTVEVKVPCGRCRYCAGGRGNLCPTGRHLGSDLPGGFAEKVALPPGALVHPVPDALDFTTAVLAEPMACAVHAVRRAGVRPGDRVAVVGLGAVGALAVHALRARSVSCVVAVVRGRYKAELATALGAEPVRSGAVRADEAPVDSCDAVVECSGDPAAAELALRLAAPGGRVSLYSVYPKPSTVDFNVLAEVKELTLAGGHLAPGCFPEAIGLLATLPAGLVVTAVRRLPELDRALGPSDGRRVKEVIRL